jgi:hypothetical protein
MLLLTAVTDTDYMSPWPVVSFGCSMLRSIRYTPCVTLLGIVYIYVLLVWLCVLYMGNYFSSLEIHVFFFGCNESRYD